MSFPAFFNAIPTIAMRDPLARLLGSVDDGILRYSYPEIVKLAGHSCPTVAGAYLMTLKGLQRLYGTDIPQRGAIRVAFRDSQQSGVTGVMANVVAFVTGATTDTGFKGLAGKFDRRELLAFDTPIAGILQLQRVDTGASVEADFHSAIVPAEPGLMPALRLAMSAGASEEQKAEFGRMWQDRVRRIFENADTPGLIVLS